MTDLVKVPFGDNGADRAVLLLAAAEATDGYDASAVSVNTDGDFGYVVPRELAEKALDGDDLKSAVDHPEVVGPQGNTVSAAPPEEPAAVVPDAPEAPARADAPEETPPAKKTAAKRTAAKKTAAKKATAKKSTTKKAV